MAESRQLNEARRILQEYIKLKNLRNTPERKAVLEAIYVVPAPFTVDSVKEYLDEVYPVTRVTVYNNLELFFHIGIIVKRTSGSRGQEYETCVLTLTHHNLCCTNCQQVFEFRDSSIMRFFEGKRYKKFKMTNCAVMIYGICSKCQAKIAREKRRQLKLEEKRKLLEQKRQAEQKKKAELRREERKRQAELMKQLRAKAKKQKTEQNNKKQ
ncbi:MAG: transcriptional repressor [Bacteroidaceae bacterium]|nr:transcriptional repressor [Bacteroidaceae bacterium]